MPTPQRSKPDDPFNDDEFWGSSETSASATPNKAPKPNAQQRYDWLKPDMLAQDRGELELLSMSPVATKYSDVTLVVKVNGKTFQLGLKTFSKAYIALEKKFGENVEDWHGKLFYKIAEYNGEERGFVDVRPAK